VLHRRRARERRGRHVGALIALGLDRHPDRALRGRPRAHRPLHRGDRLRRRAGVHRRARVARARRDARAAPARRRRAGALRRRPAPAAG
jgi:hypothetical protein